MDTGMYEGLGSGDLLTSIGVGTEPAPVTGPVSKAFVLAGDAIFTVANGKGQRYTYRVRRVEKDPAKGPVWFVSLLTGPQNTHDYTYLGMVVETLGGLTVRLTKASKLTVDSLPVRVAVWALRIVSTGHPVPAGYGIHHEGRCGRCGRLLTVPESIVSGFGPECITKIGGSL